jgi:hypothetical protein
MRARGLSLGTLSWLAVMLFILPSGAADSLADLQARFDRETNAVRMAKLVEKLGDAQFAEARRAGKEGDHSTVGLTLEKYRNNVRAALEALKKQHPDAEHQSNGYRQLQFHVRRGIREVEESVLMAPDPYKPPLEIVHQDLIAMDDELIKLLFPAHPAKPHGSPPPPEKQP